MKIIIAPDSFKDSLSAAEVANAIALGLQEIYPDAELIKCPMADGGEGTVDAILAAVAGEQRISQVTGPLGDTVAARWGWLPEMHTAIIEMAEASGLQLLAVEQRDACVTTTRGTGELISQALDLGAKHIILTVGGSATNDAGAGMLEALGARLLDAQGAALPPGGAALATLQKLDLQGLDSRLPEVSFELAADVDNPLCGPNGASYIFGGQKGASDEQIRSLDHALGHFADCIEKQLGEDHRDFPGSGAAGGIGFAARALLKAKFRPGIEVVAELTQLAQHVAGADLVITGEGRFDAQTLHGKTPLGVARIARQQQVPVIVLAGTLGAGYADIYAQGIDAAFSITSGPMSLADACSQAPQLLRERARDIARVLKL
ncbi:glycerate kinase [Pseudomonas sp. EL_65y_Pfl2_R95]|uniref:glycerate kinase n=1 Tax=Pseudomonas sp. EL_65y_Pfl2_R95 TaxID=3088698 RepID=UPI0030D72892